MSNEQDSSLPVHHYTAAGGVVVWQQQVLVLVRARPEEVRLPKGHIDPGETPAETAVREVEEESGYRHLRLLSSLGTQTVEFDHREAHVVRVEHYFLMTLIDEERGAGEAQFEPTWLSWEAAQQRLTFEAEKEWVRRARAAWT